jgi:hypothetical protein
MLLCAVWRVGVQKSQCLKLCHTHTTNEDEASAIERIVDLAIFMYCREDEKASSDIC